MERPFPAYQGDAAYIFVSYAHADAEAVYPELVRLREQGFNIWYDEGISPGSSWREELATAINDCALFLMFITPRSVKSEPCQKEVNFAESHNCR
ncbi:MAG: toll/interleukin-1 receptor domain-containing protein, partial [Gammaproteobacteria bacterium]|nr:toll/interleukin-1 receptor domain-containing protein [Gammaproteobacteria bacterium]